MYVNLQLSDAQNGVEPSYTAHGRVDLTAYQEPHANAQKICPIYRHNDYQPASVQTVIYGTHRPVSDAAASPRLARAPSL